MNEFGQTVATLLKAQNLSQRAFSEASGIDNATVSRTIGGLLPSKETLRLFCEHISTYPAERLAVFCAYARDLADASGIDRTKLIIRQVDGADLTQLDLSPEMDAYIGLLARAAQHETDLRELLSQLAHMVMRHQAAQADSVDFATAPAQPGEPAEFDPALQIIDSEIARRRATRARNKAKPSSPKRSTA